MTAPVTTPETGTDPVTTPEPAPKTETVPEPAPPTPPAVKTRPVTPKATDELTNEDNWRANSALWEKRSKENHAEAKAAQEKAAAAEARTAAQTEQMAAIAKALGLPIAGGENKPDPEALTKALSDRMHNQESRLKAMLLKEAVDNAATEHDADARGLRDSVTFQAAVADLDPDSRDYAHKVSEAVKAAVDNNPRLAKAEAKESTKSTDPEPKDDAAKAKPKAGVSGSEITAGTGATPITEAQLKRMSADEIAKAMTEGRLAHLL